MGRIPKIFCAVTALMLSMLCIYAIKPDMIVSRGVVSSYEDLSAAHGEGYMQEGNRFVNQKEDAYFIFDLGEGIQAYEALDLLLEPLEQDIFIDLYHSGDGHETTKALVSGKLSAGDEKIQFADDFRTDRFIRIYVHAPVGQAYTIQEIAIERQTVQINLFVSILILFCTCFFYVFLIKIRLMKWICVSISRIWHIYDRGLDRLSLAYRAHMSAYDEKRIRKEQYGICLLSQAALLIFIILTDRLLYATCDDTTMVAIAGGGYGLPCEYIINMHIVTGWILKALFTYVPGVNWVTVLYIFTYIISFLYLDKITLEGVSVRPLFVFARIIILDISFYLLISHFTFTVAAYASVIAGTAAILYAFKKVFEKRKKDAVLHFLAGILYFILAALIRAETIKTALVMLAVLCIYELIRHRNAKYLILEAAAFGIMVFGIQSHRILTERNPLQKEFLTWGELRSEALDCAVVPYDEERFQQAGMSKADYDACYQVFYYIKDAVSKENMQKLIEWNHAENKYNFDGIGYLIEYFRSVSDFHSSTAVCKWVFWAVFLTNLICAKTRRGRMQICSVCIGTLGVDFLYYLIQRALYRVVMPAYLLGTILCLILSEESKREAEWFQKNKISVKKIYVTGCVLFAVICTASFAVMQDDAQTAAYTQERHKVLDYMEKNNDKLFLAGDPSAFSIGVCKSVWDYAGRDYKWNLIGNWEIYSVASNQLLDLYGYSDYENIAKAAINNEHMLFLTAQSFGFEERTNYVIDLYEKYYGIRPSFQKVEDICVNTLNHTIYERWAVYEIVYPVGENNEK